MKMFIYPSLYSFRLVFYRMAIPGLLALTIGVFPQKANAQRFSHSSPVMSRSAPAPARSIVSRPAPRIESAPRPAPAPAPRVESRPVPENRPALPPQPSINGGSRNLGNHDYKSYNANSRVQTHVNIGEHANVYHTGEYKGMPPYAYHPYHPYYWGPHWHPFGFFLAALSVDAFRFSIGNQYYYYDDGCYYIPSGDGYSVVPPPIGAIVNELPEGYETTMVGNDTYYYYGGAFYIVVPQGYQVVAAPPGAVVSQLPVGAIDQQVNGEDLMVYNNVYYEPISQDGQDAYEVVPVN